MNTDILQELQQKLGAYKQRRDEAVFKECPFCGNPNNNFEVNISKQVYHCWACGEGGALVELARKFSIYYKPPVEFAKPKELEKSSGIPVVPQGVIPIEGCKDEAKVVAYLGNRGVRRQDIPEYHIMWWEPKGRIFFPFFDEIGNLIFWTARTIYKNVSPKYLHADVSKANRVVMYRGTREDTPIYIVEGVFDAITLHKRGMTVLLLFGTEISDVTVEYLRAIKRKVVLCLDKDAAGKQSKHEEMLVRALGRDNVSAFFLQGKDVAEAGLQGREGFGGFVRSKIGGFDDSVQ